MSYSSIVEYFAQLAKSYFKSEKKKKSNLLDHAVKITGFHRKSIIRHMIRRMAAIGLKQSRKGQIRGKKTLYRGSSAPSYCPFVGIYGQNIRQKNKGRFK